MVISVISVSSDSSEENTTPTVTPPTTYVDTTLTPTGIPTISPIIPPSPNYTSASPEYSPAFDTESDPSEDLSSDHILPLLDISPFISSTDDSSDNDTPDIPSSPTHGTPFTEITFSTQNLFTSDDSSRDSPSDSSSKTSSDSSSYDLSDSSSGHSSSDHSSPALPSETISFFFTGPSCKRSRSPITSVPRCSPIPGALSPARPDLLPPPKRIRSSDFTADLEDCSYESSKSSVPRETSLRDDVVVWDSDEPYLEPDINHEIQEKIDKCIAYADALRTEGIDARVIVETVAREEVETSTKSPVKVRVERVTHPAVSDDIPETAQEEGAIEGTYETLGDLGHRIVVTGQQSAVLSERISELERDNRRLRGTLDVASQRVTRLQHKELRVRREMRQIQRLRFYDRIRIARLEACARNHLGYHP
ncbi:hypothetical protein Tco_0684483 [Tanacetum coccineum]